MMQVNTSSTDSEFTEQIFIEYLLFQVTKTKHNNTKRRKTWFLVYLGGKKCSEKENYVQKCLLITVLVCVATKHYGKLSALYRLAHLILMWQQL